MADIAYQLLYGREIYLHDLGIEFDLSVSHGGMNDRAFTCKFRNARTYINTWSKLSRFGY